MFLDSLTVGSGLDKVPIKRPTHQWILLSAATLLKVLILFKDWFVLLSLIVYLYVYLLVGICMGFRVPVEARRHQVPWSWNYRRSFGRAASAEPQSLNNLIPCFVCEVGGRVKFADQLTAPAHTILSFPLPLHLYRTVPLPPCALPDPTLHFQGYFCHPTYPGRAPIKV